MKVLFVLDNYSKYFSIDDVVRLLYKRGHAVSLIVGMDKKRNVPDDALQKAKAFLPNLQIEALLKRKFLRVFARDIRELLNYAHILNNEKTRRWDVAKWDRFFHPLVWHIITSDAGKKWLKKRSIQRFLRSVEQRIPPDPRIIDQIKRQSPDIVIVLPLVNADSKENEYVLASLALGIPCVYSMFSWDNIASKGTFQSRPDYNIVWNQPLADELVQVHDVPREQIFISGAPRFDPLIDGNGEYILPRDEFCQIAGIDGNKKYALYVGSTFLVNSEFKKAGNEEEVILEIAEALQRDPRTNDINILVRPHPVNPGITKNLLGSKMRNVFVYPANGELPDTDAKRGLFYNSIYHSIAVIGINTTAFLEASALDKPCITVMTERFRETQMLPHFHHLDDANFLETANGASELVVLLERIANGIDTRAKERHEFIKTFLRPGGLNISAAEVYANLVEDIVNKKSRIE